MRSVAAVCPPGAPDSVECFSRTGTELVRGLGKVTQTYFYFTRIGPPWCALGQYNVVGAPARLTVEGKGAIDLSLADSAECRPQLTYGLSRVFTVSGGTGVYAAASGGGTLTSAGSQGLGGVTGTDTWVGTLVVPGLDFDLTPPALTGAVGKTVRARQGAKRVRVAYKVAARDEVDGVRPVSCSPKSGSLFKLGRTSVKCSATDTSANEQKATFQVTVRAGR